MTSPIRASHGARPAVLDKSAALRDLGVGQFAHVNGDLESHLRGTHALLREWGSPGYVTDAGLYHAVYGTQPMERLGIPHKPYSSADRPRIRAIIGEAAERLVYLYGACDRDFLYPRIGKPKPLYRDRFTGRTLRLAPGTFRELLEITLANELEICISGPSFREANRESYIRLFERFKGFVSDAAFTRYRAVFRVGASPRLSP